MDFGAKAAARATQPMVVEVIGMFFFAPAAAFRALILLPSSAITSQSTNFFSSRIIENTVHYSSLRPSVKAVINRLPVTVTFRQISPGSAGTKHPKYAIHDMSVREVRTATFGGPAFSRQHGRNYRPCIIREIVTSQVKGTFVVKTGARLYKKQLRDTP